MNCSVPGCDRNDRLLKGMCSMHYRRWLKHGDAEAGYRGYGSTGKRKHPMYGAYAAMLNRCSNPNNSSFGRYGARGVVVCERWKADFFNFLADMGERPAGMTLDRIDPLGPYSPENCRWASVAEQRANLSASGDRRMREAMSNGVKAYWATWRLTNTTKPKHPPHAGPRTRTCVNCGVTFTQPPVGQPRKYCSDACRARYYATASAVNL